MKPEPQSRSKPERVHCGFKQLVCIRYILAVDTTSNCVCGFSKTSVL